MVAWLVVYGDEVIRGNDIFLPSELDTNAGAVPNGAEETTAGLGMLSSSGGSAGNLEGNAGTREGDLTVRCGDPAESTWEEEPEEGLRPCTIKGGEESLGDPATDCRYDKLGGVATRGGVDTTAVDGSVGGPGADTEGVGTTGATESRGGVEAFPKGDPGDPEEWDDTERGEALTAGSLMEVAMSGHWAADCSVRGLYS